MGERKEDINGLAHFGSLFRSVYREKSRQIEESGSSSAIQLIEHNGESSQAQNRDNWSGFKMEKMSQVKQKNKNYWFRVSIWKRAVSKCSLRTDLIRTSRQQFFYQLFLILFPKRAEFTCFFYRTRIETIPEQTVSICWSSTAKQKPLSLPSTCTRQIKKT